MIVALRASVYSLLLIIGGPGMYVIGDHTRKRAEQIARKADLTRYES